MKTSTYLLYDRRRVEFEVPADWQLLEPSDPEPTGDLEAAIDHALAEPIGTRGLLELARKADKSGTAVIVISDITRAVPNRTFVPAILKTLHQAGWTRDKIKILIATGMHRPSTDAERVELLGAEIAQAYQIIDHRAADPVTLVRLPHKTSSGTSVSLDATYYDASFRILTGFIEPHFMAGFSGGRKSICPGLVDLRTVQKFHGAEFLGNPSAASGILNGNPCHRESLDVARMIPPDFVFNVTVGVDGRITGIFAGDMEKAHHVGVEFVRRHMTVKVDRPFEAVFVSGGGYPLDTTFYQTVKGMVAAGDYLETGGKVIIVSGCAQGIGSEEYRRIMFDYADDHKRFLNDIFSRSEVAKDQWEFQMQCRVLDKTGRDGLIMVTDGIGREELRRCSVTPAEDVCGSAAVPELVAKLVDRIAAGAKRVAVLPRGPYILPKVTSQ
jgi:nickel-dependent lactate racemase